MRRVAGTVLAALVTVGGVAVAGPAQAAGSYHSGRCYDNGDDAYVTRGAALARARSWVNDDVSYSQSRCYNNSYGDYRTDCSGLVSLAWGLGSLGDVWATSNLDLRSTRIAAADLLPGDVLLRYTGDPDTNHAAVFVRWSDSGRTRPVVIEQSGGVGRATERTWGSYAGYTPVRYDRIGASAPVSIYGTLADGRLTYSTIEPGSGQRLKTVTSNAALGFTPVAMATLNFNTILVTAPGGKLYRVDVITNNNSLIYDPPVEIGAGWTHDLLTYDGSGHLFGIANGVLRQYTVNRTKPAEGDIVSNGIIGNGFTLKTLAATGPDWLLGTTDAGELISYRIQPGDWDRFELRSSTWQVFDHMVSPGGGLYYGHHRDGSLAFYVDGEPFDGSGGDIRGRAPVDERGWTQTLLSAMPMRF
ncbi:tachylectin-related carbohydrate-binding protein [Actinoplanes sp. Pm04-4]|uniref:Tachylectin-related carbohydrate-binding protein n=1 Tax=Paractinoplanes pyxinae TaxID=2997416 RepID=A0ABT4BAT7_9ACTN|nr:tachylectin-related carbohydrate-binding protein [Actinoplanes pyxinae]MCY1143581.1 tachylectin-related carbohydrate-binding protein [Actinoplanes pyxinae]